MAFTLSVTLHRTNGEPIKLNINGYRAPVGPDNIEEYAVDILAFIDTPEQPIGGIRLLFTETVEIGWLEVDEEFRSLGVGTMLLQQALLASAAANFKTMKFTTDVGELKNLLLLNDGVPAIDPRSSGPVTFTWALALPNSPRH
jgi:GNAT superfamily N-acetyltransferase